MKITSIHAKKLKGRTFSTPLQDINIITGRNDKGKTAHADAIRLALLGHLPGHPETNAGIFALSSGAAMMVSAELEGYSLPVERVWKTKGKKSVIKEESGVQALPETPLVLLNAAEYFGKTDRARVEMAFSLLDLSKAEWTPAKIKLDLEKLVPATDEAGRKALDIITKEEEGMSLQEYLDKALEAAADEVSLTKKEVDRYAKTAQGIATMGLEDTPVDPAAIQAALEAARKEISDLQKAHAVADSKLQVAKREADEIRDRHKRAAELRAKVGTGPVINATLEELKEALGQAQAKVGSLQAKTEAAAEALERADEAEDALAALDDKIRNWQTSAQHLAELEKRAANLRTFVEGVARPDTAKTHQASADAYNEKSALGKEYERLEKELAKLQNDLANLETRPCCPTCGTEGESFLEAIRALYGEKIAEKKGEMEKITRDFNAATDRHKRAQAAHNAEQERRDGYDRTLEDIRINDSALQNARHAAQNLERAEEERGRLQRAAQRPEVPTPAEIEKARQTAATLQEQVDRKLAAENLAALGEIPEPPNLEEMERETYQMECDLEEKNAALERLLQSEKEAQAQLADRRRLSQADEERKAAESRHTALDGVKKRLLEIREELVHAALEPLLKVANTFTEGILDTPLEFREGEIGRQHGASWIPVRCFGGTYMAVTHAAIQAALGAQAPARIVIVDEMGRMDAENKIRFLQNVRKAIDAGYLEQFVGIDVSRLEYDEAPATLGLHIVEVKG